jgi:uncharacterized C2H2 Zn-finger protein
MDRKAYWCPKCGRMFTGMIAFRKHVDSKKCKINREKDIKNGLIKEN